MAIELANYEEKAKEAIKAFWGNRESARLKQIEAGNADQGERAGVTAGKNMDGFIALVVDIVRAAGVAKGLFYWSFENKEALFRELVEMNRLRLRQHQAAAMDQSIMVLETAQAQKWSI